MMNKQELISALADGQLTGDELARGVELAAADMECREAWRTYHLVGDVLRSGELAQGTSSEVFLSRLQESLKLEKPPATPVIEPIRVLPASMVQAAAANDSARWKLAAGVASVAAVAAIGWNVMGSSMPAAGPQLAGAQLAPPGVVLTGTESGTMIRDERLDRLIAAHRQVGGATALHTPAGFVRNATFEGPAR